jgi:hypothetical protein
MSAKPDSGAPARFRPVARRGRYAPRRAGCWYQTPGVLEAVAVDVLVGAEPVSAGTAV